jgi:diguanylate cyclase (GGDEF)-like protein
MGLHAWIFGRDLDRERLLDMDRRLASVRRNALAFIGVALLACSPWIGAWTIIPLLLAAALFTLANRYVSKFERPEYPIFGAWVASEVILAVAIVLAGGLKTVPLGLFVIPIVTLPARFSGHVVKIGTGIALVLVCAVAFGTDARAVIHNPTLIVAPCATILGVAMLLVALMRSDIEHRGECVIDQLTGLLNRKALATRSEELRQQSEVTGEPVGVIAADLDHFKAINDEHGHAAGDAALTQVAYRLRKRLRAFDLVYRLGGEEFLVLLPGADLIEAQAFAEDLRAAIADEPLSDGMAVTISMGVSASMRGSTFDFQAVAQRADKALYEAKRSGRNRVCRAAHEPPATAGRRSVSAATGVSVSA